MPPNYLDVIHLSDLHLRSNPKNTAWVAGGPCLGFTNFKTEALVSHLDVHYPDAHIVITGDVTHHGTKEAYREARRLLHPWMREKRLSVVMGNHDRGTLGNIRYSKRAKAFKETFSPTVRGLLSFPWVKTIKHVALIGLDSTAASAFAARGKIGEAQLDRLHDILNSRRVRERVVFLLLHHHVFSDGAFTALNDIADLMEVICRSSVQRVDAILFGHQHIGGYWKDEIHYHASSSSVATQDDWLRFGVFRAFDNGKIEVFSDGVRVVDRKIDWQFLCPDCGEELLYQGVLSPEDSVDCPDCGCEIDLWSCRRF
jgi:3',5'-cyclic AMP phosphodiesterase CpdA